METSNEFMARMLKEFPLAEIGEDNDGQLIIYTNLTTYVPETLGGSPDETWGDCTYVVPMVPECGDPGPECVEHDGKCD